MKTKEMLQQNNVDADGGDDVHCNELGKGTKSLSEHVLVKDDYGKDENNVNRRDKRTTESGNIGATVAVYRGNCDTNCKDDENKKSGDTRSNIVQDALEMSVGEENEARLSINDKLKSKSASKSDDDTECKVGIEGKERRSVQLGIGVSPQQMNLSPSDFVLHMDNDIFSNSNYSVNDNGSKYVHHRNSNTVSRDTIELQLPSSSSVTGVSRPSISPGLPLSPIKTPTPTMVMDRIDNHNLQTPSNASASAPLSSNMDQLQANVNNVDANINSSLLSLAHTHSNVTITRPRSGSMSSIRSNSAPSISNINNVEDIHNSIDAHPPDSPTLHQTHHSSSCTTTLRERSSSYHSNDLPPGSPFHNIHNNSIQINRHHHHLDLANPLRVDVTTHTTTSAAMINTNILRPPTPPRQSEQTAREQLIERERQARLERERARLKRQLALSRELHEQHEEQNYNGIVNDSCNSQKVQQQLQQHYNGVSLQTNENESKDEGDAGDNKSVVCTIGDASEVLNVHSSLSPTNPMDRTQDNDGVHEHGHEQPLGFTMERFLLNGVVNVIHDGAEGDAPNNEFQNGSTNHQGDRHIHHANMTSSSTGLTSMGVMLLNASVDNDQKPQQQEVMEGISQSILLSPSHHRGSSATSSLLSDLIARDEDLDDLMVHAAANVNINGDLNAPTVESPIQATVQDDLNMDLDIPVGVDLPGSRQTRNAIGARSTTPEEFMVDDLSISTDSIDTLTHHTCSNTDNPIPATSSTDLNLGQPINNNFKSMNMSRNISVEILSHHSNLAEIDDGNDRSRTSITDAESLIVENSSRAISQIENNRSNEISIVIMGDDSGCDANTNDDDDLNRVDDVNLEADNNDVDAVTDEVLSNDDGMPRLAQLTEAEILEMAEIDYASVGNMPPRSVRDEHLNSFSELSSTLAGLGRRSNVFSEGTQTTVQESVSVTSAGIGSTKSEGSTNDHEVISSSSSPSMSISPKEGAVVQLLNDGEIVVGGNGVNELLSHNENTGEILSPGNATRSNSSVLAYRSEASDGGDKTSERYLDVSSAIDLGELNWRDRDNIAKTSDGNVARGLGVATGASLGESSLSDTDRHHQEHKHHTIDKIDSMASGNSSVESYAFPNRILRPGMTSATTKQRFSKSSKIHRRAKTTPVIPNFVDGFDYDKYNLDPLDSFKTTSSSTFGREVDESGLNQHNQKGMISPSSQSSTLCTNGPLEHTIGFTAAGEYGETLDDGKREGDIFSETYHVYGSTSSNNPNTLSSTNGIYKKQLDVHTRLGVCCGGCCNETDPEVSEEGRPLIEGDKKMEFASLRHLTIFSRRGSLESIVDSVFSSVRSVSTEDIEANVNDSDKYLTSSVLSRAFSERFAALVITLIVEIPVLLMISGGSDRLCGLVGRRRYQLLMAFLPLSSAISGNCGLQASTLCTRAISHLHITKDNYMSWLLSELYVASLLGVGMGLILGIIAFQASNFDTVFSLTIFTANFVSVLTAGFTGTLAPLVFTFFFHRDSGKWGGPLETAFQDIVGSFAMVVLSYKMLLWLGPMEVDPADTCGN